MSCSSPHCQLYEEHGWAFVLHSCQNRGLTSSPFLRIPLVLYDQLGSGQSSHYRDCSGGFFTPSLFSDQLESLLIHLEINDNYDLLGHSWGGTRVMLVLLTELDRIVRFPCRILFVPPRATRSPPTHSRQCPSIHTSDAGWLEHIAR